MKSLGKDCYQLGNFFKHIQTNENRIPTNHTTVLEKTTEVVMKNNE